MIPYYIFDKEVLIRRLLKKSRLLTTQPRRAKTRLAPNKAAASEDRGRYPPHFVGPFAHSMDLGKRKTPPVLPTSEELLFNFEDLNDARTMLADFFSGLLRAKPG